MIERYSQTEMTRLWTDQYRFEKMLEVELLATEALVKAKQVPAAAYAKLRQRAKVNVARIRQIEQVVKHDVIAFVTQVGEKCGPESRFLHIGTNLFGRAEYGSGRPACGSRGILLITDVQMLQRRSARSRADIKKRS